MAKKGERLSDETKAKMSASHRERPLSPAHCLAMSIANKGHRPSPQCFAASIAARKDKLTGPDNPMWGKHHTIETKTAIRVSLKANPIAVAHLEMLHEKRKGTHHTPAARAKISAAMSLAKTGKPNGWQGKRHTDETRARMSAAAKTSPLAIAHRVVMSEANKGRPLSRAHRAALRAANTPEVRAKKSAAKQGPKHPRWLGGISREPYGWEWNAELREEVRRRDGYQCQLCGVSQEECAKALAVHHIDYCKKNSDPVNLVTLCRRCHSRTNTNRPRWTALFQGRDLARAVKG